MGRVIKVIWQEGPEELYAQYQREESVPRRKRLQALWLLRSGASVAEAGRLTGIGGRTVQRWLRWYRQDGLAAVLARVPGHAAPGNACRLTAAQRAAVREQASQGQWRTYDQAREWIAAQWGVHYSYHGAYTLLRRLAIRPKVPRPVAAKADQAVQTAWKKGASRER